MLKLAEGSTALQPTHPELDKVPSKQPVDQAAFAAATVGFKTRFWRGPDHDNLVRMPKGVDTWVLDFDHTVGLTERLHRTSFRECAWRTIEQDQRAKRSFSEAPPEQQRAILEPLRERFDTAWMVSGFQDGFGKPERKTCEIVTECLKAHFGIDVDPDQIRLRRFAVINHAQKTMRGENPDRDAVSLCKIDDVIAAINHAKPIEGLLPTLQLASRRDPPIRIGLCTGSSSEFVAGMLTTFGLDSMVPAEFRVFANHYDPKLGKPNPEPFHITFNRMKLESTLVNGKPCHPNVMIFEDSISGLTAGLASGANVAFSPGQAYGPMVGFIHAVANGMMPVAQPGDTSGKSAKMQNAALKLRDAMEFSKKIGTEMLLMSPGMGWSQLAFPNE